MVFFRSLRQDFKRLSRSKNFYFAVLLTAFITAVSLLPDIWEYGRRMSVYSLARSHGSGTDFFLIMTVLVALPFGLSYREDERHNYLHGILSRRGLAGYCWSHVAVTAAAGFLTVFLGYALCYVLAGFFFPMIHPEESFFSITVSGRSSGPGGKAGSGEISCTSGSCRFFIPPRLLSYRRFL